MLSPELAWRRANNAPEMATEVALVCEPELAGNVSDRLPWNATQQVTSSCDAQLQLVFVGRKTGRTLEHAGKVEWREVECGREFRQSDVLIQPVVKNFYASLTVARGKSGRVSVGRNVR